MLAYLSKKIGIPNQLKLHCISWNQDQGWIACGGESGLLKVLKLEAALGQDSLLRGVAAQSNLSMNQTLEGHSGAVMRLAWNPTREKLTSSDEKGLIIVWVLHNGSWFEEMINNRNKSVVRDMKWTSDGSRICIVYEDGAVIVGSVEGSRLWGKELNVTLQLVEWSPDMRSILFVTADSDVLLYDADGTKLKALTIGTASNKEAEESVVAAVAWFGWSGIQYQQVGGRLGLFAGSYAECPNLCIALECGVLQLSKGEDDPKPIMIDTDMTVISCKWNSFGSVLAVAGQATSKEKTINLVKFYSPYGKLLRSLRVPGERISELTWEGGGLRMALSVDAFIFFANVRPSYAFAHLGTNTVVYGYRRPERKEGAVVFWQIDTMEVVIKAVGGVVGIVGCGEHCALLIDESSISNNKNDSPKFSVQIRDTVGAIIDRRVVPFVPKHMTMGPSSLILANDRTVYVWQFTSTSAAITGSSSSKERIFDIEAILYSQPMSLDAFRISTENIMDPITALAASDRCLVVGCRSGNVLRFSLPHLHHDGTFTVSAEPMRMSLSSLSTKLAVLDGSGTFAITDLQGELLSSRNTREEKKGEDVATTESVKKAERRDVWDMLWAEDNDDMIVIMEKTKMVVLRGDVAEDPVISAGYLGRFSGLEIRCLLLDEVFRTPEAPAKEHIADYEAKALRDARDALNQGTAAELTGNAPHPRIYRLLAENALEKLNLTEAEKYFVLCGDYSSVQLVKSLRGQTDKMKARAGVAVALKRYDEAEAIYREIDRKDLAIAMREQTMDYNRVIQLLQTGGGNDALLRSAWDKLGSQYFDKYKYRKALQYFKQSRNMEMLAECYYRLEMFKELEELKTDVPDGTPLLAALAEKFERLGMHTAAVDCYIRCGNPKAAVDCCVVQNRWDLALSLAEQHDFPQVEGLLARYASQLVAKDKKLDAVELYRRADRPTDAALLIGEIAELAATRDVNPSLAKKLHVLSALEIERHRKKALDAAATQATAGGTGMDIAVATAATLETLMMTSLDTQDGAAATLTAAGGGRKASRAFGSAWRGGAAYHYYMLAQRLYYAGQYDAAMKCSIKLCEYDDILSPRDIYSLLAITAFSNKFYGTCSQAFVKLETIASIPDADRDAIETLAVKVFVKHSPADPATLAEPYVKCLNLGKPYKACLVTGRAILESAAYTCRTCRHPVLENERGRLLHCPLCHTPMSATSDYL